MDLCAHLEATAYGTHDDSNAAIVDVISEYANHLLPYAACAAVATLINIAILPFAHNDKGCIKEDHSLD